jgi:hypothetical protein
MADQLQLRGGTTTEHNTFTGASKEVTVDTTKKTAVVHDGATAGGNPLMREDGSNSALALGSQGTPSLKFTGDTNTGIYSPGADQVAISTGGTGRLFVNASGRVGIGTTSALKELQINATTPTIRLEENSGGSKRLEISIDSSALARIDATQSGSQLLFGTVGTERARITSDGNVGIGTTSVGAKLHVATAGNNYIVSHNTTGSTSALLLGAESGSTSLYSWTTVSGSTGVPLKFFTGATEAMRLDTSGRLGIGTTSPGQALSVVGNIVADGSAVSQYVASSKAGVTSTYLMTDANGANIQVDGAWPIRFTTNSSESARIDSSGNVGIGTSSPGSKLEVYRGTIALNANEPGDTTKLSWKYQGTEYQYIQRDNSIGGLAFGDNTSERMRLDSSGRLLVGTSSAFDKYFNSSGTYAPLLQVQGSNISTSSASLYSIETTANGPFLILGKSRNNAVVSSGDSIGAASFQGYDGSELVEGARIYAEVDGTPGVNDMPGRLVFSTTAVFGGSPTERMRIKSSGIVNIANTPTYADNTAALADGLVAGDVYRKSDGTLMITY